MPNTIHVYSRRQAAVAPIKKHHYKRWGISLLLIGMLTIPPLVKPRAVEATKTKSTAVIAIQESYAAQTKLLNQVSTRGLDSVQLQLLQLAKQQFATHATSYDSTVMEYTQGSQESWCSDFISWLRNQAGVPFINPTSGSWRIPGVDTLQDYYQQYNAYYAVGDYTPKLGDVAFYNDTNLSGDNTAHVAMVLGVSGNNVITIGGNEGTGDGTIQVRSDPLQDGYLGLSGFGDSTL